MGIHGLWRLLEPTGRDVTLESLQNKVLAIDVSLWLYQAQQGSAYGGSTAANAHLLTLFHRISKLLFYRVKPVFVFDGEAPGLKKKTIFARKQKKQVARDRAEEMRQQLFLSLAKTGVVDPAYIQAQASTAGPSPKKTTPKKGSSAKAEEEDLYKLPPLPEKVAASPQDESSGESSLSDEDDRDYMSYYDSDEDSKAAVKYQAKGKIGGGWKKLSSWVDPHEVDLQSESFKALPVEVRHEILTDLKEARKESSWGRLHKMPKDLGNFSSFQMTRLLHRRKVQEVLEKVEEEISTSEAQGASLGELEAMLVEKGVTVERHTSQRIASDERKGFILVSGLKDQSKGGGKDDERKPDPGSLAVVKEEPEDSDYIDVKELEFQKLLFESSKNQVTPADECKGEGNESISQSPNKNQKAHLPTLTEEKLLTSNQIVKKFLMSVTETSNNTERTQNESGEFESISSAMDEGDLSQGEIMAIIKTEVTNAGSSTAKKVISSEVKVSNDIFLCAKPAAGKEDVVEVIEGFSSGEDENGLTQEQMMRIISDQKRSLNNSLVKKIVDDPKKCLNPASLTESAERNISNPVTPAATDDEVVVEKISDNSESEESDFLEVEDGSEHSQSNTEKSRVKSAELEKVVAENAGDFTKKIPQDKKLEVVVNVDAAADIGDDIFADVFVAEEPKQDSESKVTASKEVINTTVTDAEAKEELDNPLHEQLDSGVTYIDDTSGSEPGDVTEVEPQEKVAENPEAADVPLPAQSKEASDLTDADRRKLTLELRKKELEGKAGVTDRARIESQELLGLFGVPWVVAPYEAEAQCAFLESVTFSSPRKGTFSRSLVEGTVTEDSDVWAFGASRVYRHVFDRKRIRVRVYSREEVERKLGIDRIRMVQLALLTGSDYTEGIPGIGTVSALEILAAFPGDKKEDLHRSADPEVDAALSGLQRFADWWKRVERNEKEGTPVGHSFHDPPEAVAKALRRRLCSCLKALDTKQSSGSLLPPGFPSRAVVQAYLKPSVDGCTDAFTWLKPDEAALRCFAKVHFGWSEERINSILRPLFARLKLSDCVDRQQMSINSFFSRASVGPTVINTKGTNLGVRTKKALERISGISEEIESSPPKKKKRVARKTTAKANVIPEEEKPISDEDFDTSKSPGKQQPVKESSKEGRVICEDDYERRDPTGKLELMRKKFSKELGKIRGSRATKSSISNKSGKTQGNAEEKYEEFPSTEDSLVANEVSESDGKIFSSEKGGVSSDDDFDFSISPGKRTPVKESSKDGRVICDDDYERRDPTGKLELKRRKFSKELGKMGAPKASKSSVSPAAGKTVEKGESSVPSSSSKVGQVAIEAGKCDAKKFLVFEKEGISSDDDFDMSSSPGKRLAARTPPKIGRVICEDDYDQGEPSGQHELLRKNYCKELFKGREMKSVMSQQGTCSQESAEDLNEEEMSSKKVESPQLTKEAAENEIKELLALVEERGLSDDDFEMEESPVIQQQPQPAAQERVICEDDYDRRDPTGKLELWRKKFAKELAKVKKPRATKSSKISFGPGPSSRPRNLGNMIQGNKTLAMDTGFASSLYTKEKIPQRERDNDSALQSRMKAIEVMRKSSMGSGKRAAPKKSSTGRGKKLRREEVHLSESSDSN
ncbi:DNA excision repair protein ERCC-5 [Ischnura elegans]|uniref:DNA excision repair protein ERCC-5 n=1 Tax=Ischnura elegans TaxID=197161 RepID=UPI001ED86FA2|nr:DNA excision repair protein ERCC-5 [Ischnura elegans]